MHKSIKVISTPAEFRQYRRGLKDKRVGFVPTMGALHDGHAELLKKLRPRCDLSVLSIFVNPTQFGPKEDLAKYPRTFERDLEVARAAGVDVVFAPSADQMYPEGFSTFVEEKTVSEPLCGRFRPGHFRGVTTIVLKLFNIVQPELALFGLKDAQQFFVLSKMVEDLNMGVELLGIPTVRSSSDGLALSSRNAYLSPEDRTRAPLIYKTLRATVEKIKTKSTIAQALDEGKQELERNGFETQYLELLELPSFQAATSITHAESIRFLSEYEPLTYRQVATKPHYLLATAAILGTTRLIDNVIFEAASSEIKRA